MVNFKLIMCAKRHGIDLVRHTDCPYNKDGDCLLYPFRCSDNRYCTTKKQRMEKAQAFLDEE